jgi:hypothetical protein
MVKAEWVACETVLMQPSARNAGPSPAECVEIIVPLGEGVVLDVVHDSHKMPEFTLYGISRWVSGGMDRYEMQAGTAVIVGAGTIYRISCAGGAMAVWVTCLLARGMPSVTKDRNAFWRLGWGYGFGRLGVANQNGRSVNHRNIRTDHCDIAGWIILLNAPQARRFDNRAGLRPLADKDMGDH